MEREEAEIHLSRARRESPGCSIIRSRKGGPLVISPRSHNYDGGWLNADTKLGFASLAGFVSANWTNQPLRQQFAEIALYGARWQPSKTSDGIESVLGCFDANFKQHKYTRSQRDCSYWNGAAAPDRRHLNYDYFLAEIKTLFQLAQDSRPVMPNKAHTRPIF